MISKMEEFTNYLSDCETKVASTSEGWFWSESDDSEGEEIHLDLDHDDTDLEVVAKIGKALLAQNKKLRSRIETQNIEIEEKDLEIEHLRKKLTALQNMHESRLELLDQVEVSTQELENENLSLKNNNNDLQLKIQDLNGDIYRLEAECESLDQELQETKNRGHESLESTKRERDEMLKENSMFLQVLIYSRSQCLEEKLRMSEETLKIEIREREEAEGEVYQLLQENNELCKRISELEGWRSQKGSNSDDENLNIKNCKPKPVKSSQSKKSPETKSLLSELEEQYRKLIQHYNDLIEEKERRRVAEGQRNSECPCQCKNKVGKTVGEESRSSAPATTETKETIRSESKSQRKRLSQVQRRKLERENKSKVLSEQTQNKHLNATTTPNTPSHTPNQTRRAPSTTPAGFNARFSVSNHVAQLRSFERSFADVLKFNIKK